MARRTIRRREDAGKKETQKALMRFQKGTVGPFNLHTFDALVLYLLIN